MESQLSSPLFADLCSRVRVLESHFLPLVPSPLGDYTEEQQLDAKACVLLVHAEVETYLEGISRLLCTTALDQIKAGRYSELSSAFIFEAGHDQRVVTSCPNSLEEASRAFHNIKCNQIKANNGIKENDLKHLFGTFSLITEDFPPELTVALNSFGALRGRCAHTSAIGAQKTNDCFEIRTQIDELMELLKSFDSIYSKWTVQAQ